MHIYMCLLQIGRSPLHVASNSGHCSVIELLIKSKANVDIQDEVNVTLLYQREVGTMPII